MNRDYRSLFFFSSSFLLNAWPPAGSLSHQHVAYEICTIWCWLDFEPTSNWNEKKRSVWKFSLCQIENVNEERNAKCSWIPSLETAWVSATPISKEVKRKQIKTNYQRDEIKSRQNKRERKKMQQVLSGKRKKCSFSLSFLFCFFAFSLWRWLATFTVKFAEQFISLFLFFFFFFPVEWWCPWAPCLVAVTARDLCWSRSLGECLSLSLFHMSLTVADHWSIVPYTTSSSSEILISFRIEERKSFLECVWEGGELISFICVNKLKQIVPSQKYARHARAATSADGLGQ